MTMLDRWRRAEELPRMGLVRLPAFVAGRWSSAALRAARLATRELRAAAGRVHAHERLDDGASVLERLEITITAVRRVPPDVSRRARRREESLQVYRVIHDRAVDFLIGDVGVEVAACEPVLPAQQAEPSQELLDQAARLVPELADRSIYGVRVRRAVLVAGDEVEARGEPHDWIDPTVDNLAYRDLPIRHALGGQLLLFHP